MAYSEEMLRCILDCDAAGAMRLWRHVNPTMPQPKNEKEAVVQIHIARTQMESVPFLLRAYSHRFLIDNGYPSFLPDVLKPKAERVYPKIVTAVGISVNMPAIMAPVAAEVEKAMSDAVADAYAENRTESNFLRKRMMSARQKTIKKFLG
jgi:hypothetical protein